MMISTQRRNICEACPLARPSAIGKICGKSGHAITSHVVRIACPVGHFPEFSPAPPIDPARLIKLPPAPPRPVFTGGPGTELKRIFAKMGIKRHGCQCNALANTMDKMGPDWCEAHIGQVVAGVIVNAQRRKWAAFIPFKAEIVEELVRRAIATARERSVPNNPTQEQSP